MIDFGPGSLFARNIEADEASLVPHEGDLATGHGEISEPHRTSVLHPSHDPTDRTSDDLAFELNVNLRNLGFVVDAENAHALEVDKELVHEGRVRDHGGSSNLSSSRNNRLAEPPLFSNR